MHLRRVAETTADSFYFRYVSTRRKIGYIKRTRENMISRWFLGYRQACVAAVQQVWSCQPRSRAINDGINAFTSWQRLKQEKSHSCRVPTAVASASVGNVRDCNGRKTLVILSHLSQKTKYGIRFHLLLMYHVIPRMRSANFVNRYGDFGTPSISMERFNVETSYSVGVFIITSICQQMTNYPLKRAWSGSRDLNLKFGTSSITFEWIKLRTSNFVG